MTISRLNIFILIFMNFQSADVATVYGITDYLLTIVTIKEFVASQSVDSVLNFVSDMFSNLET